MANRIESTVVQQSGYHFNFQNEVFGLLEMQARQRLYSRRPDVWAQDMLGVTLWSKQVEVALSVVENRNTMVAACHASGKSFLTAVLACWWIDTHPVGDAKVLSTAPSSSQVRNIIWADIQKFHILAKSRHNEYLRRKKAGESTHSYPDHHLPGYVTSSATWKTDEGIPIGYGRTPPRGREGDTFQGIHGNVFAIGDEAVGLSEAMIDTLNNNTTASGDRRLLIANPTNPASYMGQIWRDKEKSALWNRITISAFDTPKIKNDPAELESLPEETLEGLVDWDYINEKKVDYGEDSANYKARVLGEWASDTDMIMFTEDILGIATDTIVIPHEGDAKYVGFDVSRSIKGDYSYLYLVEEGWVYETQYYSEKESDWVDYETPKKTERRGIRVRFLDRWRGMPFQTIHNHNGQVVEEGANKIVHAHMLATGAAELRIDVGGMGVNMMDAMLDIYGAQYEIVEIDGSSTPPSGTRKGHYNLRAYGYSELARRMREGTVDIDPDDTILLDQLAGIEYKFAAGYADSMLIEAKEDMRRKGLSSPDAADAVWMGAVMVNVENLDNDGYMMEYDYSPIVNEFDHFYGSKAW